VKGWGGGGGGGGGGGEGKENLKCFKESLYRIIKAGQNNDLLFLCINFKLRRRR